MEWFGLTRYGFPDPFKDMMRPDYKEPMKQKTTVNIDDDSKNFTDLITELDVYIGHADGYAYGSNDRLRRMRRKGIFKPVGNNNQKAETRQTRGGPSKSTLQLLMDKPTLDMKGTLDCQKISLLSVKVCSRTQGDLFLAVREKSSFYRLQLGEIYILGDERRYLVQICQHGRDRQLFQQDGATCHTADATMMILHERFKDILTSRTGPNDMYKYPGTSQMHFGWWKDDPSLKGETWYKPDVINIYPSSETTRYVNNALKIDKLFRL